MNYKPIIVTAGDPESVFYEIFFKSLKKKIFLSPIILISSKDVLLRNMKSFKFYKKIRYINVINIKKLTLSNNTINLIDVKLKTSKQIFKNKKYINDYINNCYELAFNLIKKKFTNKIITGPINKKKFLNKKFLGITEFISKKFNNKNTGMLIYNKQISVCPLTTHLPIKLVSKNITKSMIKNKINLINSFYKNVLNFKPKIAVVGLNPHCESILKINEDEKIIKPIINNLKKKNINVNGPFSADTIFLKQNRKKFNVIVGMYHDQVLAPMKTLFEYDAINITMGLPFLRVSPDHGPNIEMINKNISNPISLIRALEFLDKI
jgi:4-hydroxythreonine-4-phosphate dehydrogenase